MSADAPPAVTVESVEAHLRARHNADLPTCPRCEQAPVQIQEVDLPSQTPTGRVGSLLGNPIHLRRAVVIVCSDEEGCAGMGIEITGMPAPAGSLADPAADLLGDLAATARLIRVPPTTPLGTLLDGQYDAAPKRSHS